MEESRLQLQIDDRYKPAMAYCNVLSFVLVSSKIDFVTLSEAAWGKGEGGGGKSSRQFTFRLVN